MIEERNFPEAMAIIHRLKRFEDVYKARNHRINSFSQWWISALFRLKATAENENLKIQIAAAESTAANVFAENQRLQQLLEVNSIIILIDFIHIPTDKRWFNHWSENRNELFEEESIVDTSQGPTGHLASCRMVHAVLNIGIVNLKRIP